MSAGKVWLVGAGPGDPGLLTCRGREVLESADTVIYDRLVGDGVLALMPRRAKQISAGKEGGGSSVSQHEIEELLINEALAGKKVVRLKGGDPFLFGRGGEELETLAARGVPFEVVPGVTSAIAAPGCAGIPVTHRGCADSLHIITAHTRLGDVAHVDFAALARSCGTLVFLMGVSVLPELCETLAQNGFPAETPIAAVEWGTTARQRTLEGTLGGFPAQAAAFGLKSPSVIVVGNTVRLAEKFAWRQALPLSGKKVIITRPRRRQSRLSRMLRDLGAEAVEFPVIETVPLNEPLPNLSAEWIGFTSATGAECFFAALASEGRDIREIASANIAAIGPATAAALRERGLRVDLVPQVYDGAHLARELVARAGSGKILLFRAQNGSPELGEILRASGANFSEIPLYRTEYLQATFTPRGADAVVFASASSVRAFRLACPSLEVPLACCIGEQTAREAARLGLKNIRTAARATLEDLVETLLY